MKLIKGILGCALAAGLTTFASNQAQAIIINGDNYVPFNLKLKGSFDNGNGKIGKHSFSSKDALKDAGFNGKVTLALGPGTENDFDVYVIQNKGKNSSVIADLSTNGIFVVEPDQVFSTEKGNTESSVGTIVVSYDSEESILATSDDFFTLDGVYSASETDNDNKINQKFKATSLSGSGFFGEIDEDATVEGSASGSSGGKFTD